MEKLENFVMKIEELPGLNSQGQVIKVVTFNYDKIIGLAKALKFQQFLKLKALPNEIPDIYHYYITYAFPWLQPSRLRHFSKPIKNERVVFEIFTFLTCMRELSYDKEPHLNIYDLCSLKLAFCDFRQPHRITRDLEFEIDALLIRSLKRMIKNKTYIENKLFNYQQYAIDTQTIPRMLHVYYTQHHFQKYFKAIIVYTQFFVTSENGSPYRQTLQFTMQLSKYNDPVKILQSTPDVHYQVDGTHYKHMNFELFFAILRCPNVTEILLDTNYDWNTNENRNASALCDIDRFPIRIWLHGSNSCNFIEKFVSSVKVIKQSYYFELFINSALQDYSVLNNFRIGNLIFYDIQITMDMLDRLRTSNHLGIEFKNCSIENNWKIWRLINELNTIVWVREDNYTWQNIFEYAANVLMTIDVPEFKIKTSVCILDDDGAESVNVNQIKFTINPAKTRLELTDVASGQSIDLFTMKNSKILLPGDDKSVYDFYQ